MSHLIAIAVGPVQEFIAAARRTRDLWFGSYLLSEISRAVAKSVEADGGKLIFPASSEAGNVANVILAELPSGEPRDVAAKAKQAAQTRWLKFASEAHQKASGVIRQDIWDDQVKDVIEFYAAWVSHTDDKKYQIDRATLMRLLAGRKNCRDFFQATDLDRGLPKSSLDGQRATVLQGPKHHEKPATYRNRWPKAIRQKLRVRTGEQLDVVGVVKRVAEGNKPFPSVSRIAADIWIRGIVNRGGGEVLAQFVSQCNDLPSDVVHRLTGFSQFSDFPFEGTTLFRSRHHEWWEETEDAPEREREQPAWYAEFDSQLKALEDFAACHGVGKEPNPYLAVLVADGDKMGAAISALTSPKANREFSSTLAGFADSARTIVNDHNGVLVYAGGDDVLAFLPVDKCLGCARKLHDDFGARLAKYGTPTLSVGIAIGHFMENLEDLLDYGRAAEKAAKNIEGKDALAVHLHKRGGAPIRIARRWEQDSDNKLTLYAELMQKEALPSKLPYDLQKLAEVYEADGWNESDRLQAMRQDTLRVVADKQPRAGKAYMHHVHEIVQKLGSVKDLRLFGDELLVARLLADVFDQAKRQPTQLVAQQKEGAA